MVFDKQAYWHRRKFTRPVEVDDPKKPGKKMTIEVPAPMRGQEPLPRPVVAKWTREDFEAGKCEKAEIGKPREPKNMEYRMDPKRGLVPFPRRERRAEGRQNKKRSYYTTGLKPLTANQEAELLVAELKGNEPVKMPHREPVVASRKYTQKGVVHEVGTPNEGIVLPRTDPKLTNHDRMVMRQRFRKESAKQAREDRIAAKKKSSQQWINNREAARTNG